MGCSSTAGGRRGVHVEGRRGLPCKRFVRELTRAVYVCVRKLSVGSHSNPLWSTLIHRLVETVNKDGTRYRQNWLTQIFFIFVSLFLFIYASKLWLKCLSPVVLIKWQPYWSFPLWFKEKRPVVFRNPSLREEALTRHLSWPSQERRNNIILEAV